MADDTYLLVDFGSTYTKILALDLSREEILGRAQSPTTVESNILNGLQNALKKLKIKGRSVDESDIRGFRKLASSSAAGGLCIVAVGLVPDLTLEAAQKAALGAGAKVVGSYSYELDNESVRTIENSQCDMLLLVGGTDGGNKDVILYNADMLSRSQLNVPFIVAGNKAVSDRARDVLESGGKYVEKVENVLPELDRLNVEPARSCIRDIFMKRIVHAKGLDRAEEFIGQILMPTPMATLKAACLLADGSGTEPGLGELMVVEVGGATTNVHSVATGYSQGKTVVTKGIPEPYAKRTVEGDLGIRYNAPTILTIAGAQKVSRNMMSKDMPGETELEAKTSFLSGNVGFVPVNEDDILTDAALAKCAVEIAVERHAGKIKEIWSPEGEMFIQHGKDLSELKTIIGTGGIFAHNPYAASILEAALYDTGNPYSLRPKNPELYLDKNYLLYGIGLLSSAEPVRALKIAKKYLLRAVVET